MKKAYVLAVIVACLLPTSLHARPRRAVKLCEVEVFLSVFHRTHWVGVAYKARLQNEIHAHELYRRADELHDRLKSICLLEEARKRLVPSAPLYAKVNKALRTLRKDKRARVVQVTVRKDFTVQSLSSKRPVHWSIRNRVLYSQAWMRGQTNPAEAYKLIRHLLKRKKLSPALRRKAHWLGIELQKKIRHTKRIHKACKSGRLESKILRGEALTLQEKACFSQNTRAR